LGQVVGLLVGILLSLLAALGVLDGFLKLVAVLLADLVVEFLFRFLAFLGSSEARSLAFFLNSSICSLRRRLPAAGAFLAWSSVFLSASFWACSPALAALAAF